ncbi:MAG TPA: class I SAM-dependent methyltransferase [Phenylobacterium sp.]|jgi:SAM-dependent methyltransferase|nr:class I SAM-dependent methyltransferase [Phenylobacterium sp.]
MQFNGKTRFQPDAIEAYAKYKGAAVNYVANLALQDRRGLREKPLDWNPGHPSYFSAMTQLLAALQLMKLPVGADILEVGSGAGWATEIMASLCYSLNCIEPAAEMIAVARERVHAHLAHHGLERLATNVTFHCATIEECELPAGSADAAIYFESFHHVVDEHRALKRTFEALRPGGWLVILGDSNWIPGNREQETAWTAEMKQYGTLESPFTAEYLVWLLGQHGFTDVARNHLVTGLVPTDRDSEPVAGFALMDAQWVNLVTARKPPVGWEASRVASLEPAEVRREATSEGQARSKTVRQVPAFRAQAASVLRRLACALAP